MNWRVELQAHEQKYTTGMSAGFAATEREGRLHGDAKQIILVGAVPQSLEARTDRLRRHAVRLVDSGRLSLVLPVRPSSALISPTRATVTRVVPLFAPRVVDGLRFADSSSTVLMAGSLVQSTSHLTASGRL